MLQGVGQNLDLAASTSVAIVYAATSVHPTVDESDTLTLRISHNVVASAEFLIDLYYGLGV